MLGPYLSSCLLHVQLDDPLSAPHFLQLLESLLTLLLQLSLGLKQGKLRNSKVVLFVEKMLVSRSLERPYGEHNVGVLAYSACAEFGIRCRIREEGWPLQEAQFTEVVLASIPSPLSLDSQRKRRSWERKSG